MLSKFARSIAGAYSRNARFTGRFIRPAFLSSYEPPKMPRESVLVGSEDIEEPENLVDPEGYVNPRDIHVTYTTDEEKQLIYAMFMANPVENDVKAIAEALEMNPDRVQAIIFLMHKRYTMMREKGLTVTVVVPEGFNDESEQQETNADKGDDDEDAADDLHPDDIDEIGYTEGQYDYAESVGLALGDPEGKGLPEGTFLDEEFLEQASERGLKAIVEDYELFRAHLPSIKVEIPPLWSALYEAHKADKSRSPASLLTAYNAKQEDDSTKTSMSAEELQKVLTDLDDHFQRLDNILAYEEAAQEFLLKLADGGVDIDFRETPSVSARARRFEKNYFPKTLHDEDVETETQRLVEKIKSQTKATVSRNREYYHERFDGDNYKAPTAQGNDKPMRWKLGFRELGKKKKQSGNIEGQSDDNVLPPRRTVIRTRTGAMRHATPLEEAGLSWSRRPTYLDRVFAETFGHLSEKYLKPFKDIDGNDHLTVELNKKKQKELRINAAKAKDNATSENK